MKRFLLPLALFMGLFSAASAQDENREVGTTTKSGQQILPQKGDFAIGVDANPFFKYLGNSFNGSTDNDNTNFFSFEDDVFQAPSIYGKYFLSDKTAIRVKLHLGFSSDTYKYEEDKHNSTTGEMVENEENVKTNGLGLRVGYEYRRGYGRLQGFFGPEIGLGFFSNSRTYDYGNRLSYGDRLVKETSGNNFMLLAGGFAGVEYFVGPKISVGGEVGMSFKLDNRGDGKKEYEVYGESNYTEKTGSRNSTGFGTKYSGNIFVTFHF